MPRLSRWSVPAALAALLSACPASATVLVDRFYRLGDDPAEGAVNGVAVSGGGTFDSAGVAFGVDEFVDLFPGAGSAPSYAAVTGRPDGVGGRGLDFDPGEFVHGARLGLPDTSVSSLTPNYDYTGVSNRGLQLWARPDAFVPGTPQTLVADTLQHGVRINAAGRYAMVYAGSEFDSGVAAVGGQWRHLMVVRPDGPAGGARMYIDGLAVAAASGGYDGDDTADLVLGADTGGTADSFTGGLSGFYSGLLDSVELFVIGNVRGPNPANGNAVEQFTATFDFATDNDFAAFRLSAVEGDLDQNGVVNAADRAAFIGGWRSEKRLDGVLVGDLSTISRGDLNFDGVTDIEDLARFQSALVAGGLSRITTAEILAVPEPTSLAVAALSLTLALTTRRGVR